MPDDDYAADLFDPETVSSTIVEAPPAENVFDEEQARHDDMLQSALSCSKNKFYRTQVRGRIDDLREELLASDGPAEGILWAARQLRKFADELDTTIQQAAERFTDAGR